MKDNRRYVYKQVKPYIRGNWAALIIMTAANALTVSLTVANPKIFQMLIDNVMGKSGFPLFYPLAGAFLAVFLIKTLLEFFVLKLGNKLNKRFTLSLRRDLWEKIQNAPFQFINKFQAGDLKMRLMDDVDSLGNFLNSQIMEYLLAVLTILVTLCIVFMAHPLMAGCCLLSVPLVYLFNAFLGKRSEAVNEDIRSVNERYYTSTHESLQLWKEIKYQGMEQQAIKKFTGYRNILAKLGIKSMLYWSFWEIFNDFKANYLTRVMVYVIGAFFVISHEISIGTLFMFAEYFALLFSAIDTVSYKRSELRMNFPYFKRIFEMLTLQTVQKKDSVEITDIHTLSCKEIAFSYYNREEPVLQGVSFELKKGELVAIVGENGSGKTTLLKLLLCLCLPQRGKIQINQIEQSTISDLSFFSLTGAVMQDSFLFDRSIRENLCLGNPEATEEELTKICAAVNLLVFIGQLTHGFDTIIGERGGQLSGGQRQRLALARALLKKPKLLILDEALSGVDNISGEIITRTLRRLAGDCICIFVTHSPREAQSADKVIFLDGGIVAAAGPHQELLKQNQRYRSLMNEGDNNNGATN